MNGLLLLPLRQPYGILELILDRSTTFMLRERMMTFRLRNLIFLSGLLLCFTSTLAGTNKDGLVLPFLTFPAGSTTFTNNSANSGSVASVIVNFFSDPSCGGSFLGQKIVNSGSPVQFSRGLTIGISPDSMYTAANDAGIITSNIHSVTVVMQDSVGNVFLAAGPSYPCAQISCSGTACIYSGAPISIDFYSP